MIIKSGDESSLQMQYYTMSYQFPTLLRLHVLWHVLFHGQVSYLTLHWTDKRHMTSTRYLPCIFEVFHVFHINPFLLRSLASSIPVMPTSSRKPYKELFAVHRNIHIHWLPFKVYARLIYHLVTKSASYVVVTRNLSRTVLYL